MCTVRVQVYSSLQCSNPELFQRVLKLALGYPEAPADVRELKSSELGAEDDFIDAEEVKDEE